MPVILRPRRLQALLLAALLPFAAQAQTPRLIGYVMDSPAPLQLSAQKLDVVNFAFAVVKPDGSVYLPENVDPARLHAVVAKRADNPSLQIVLSIGGWGAGNFSEAAATAPARARFIDSSVALISSTAWTSTGNTRRWAMPTSATARMTATTSPCCWKNCAPAWTAKAPASATTC